MRRSRYLNGGLDSVDEKILLLLSRDGRCAIKDIASAVGLSSPSVAERLKRLEECGAISAYRAVIDPAALGLPLAVYIRVKPLPGEVARTASNLAAIPEISLCERVTGEDCYIAKAHVASVEHLERLIDQILPYAATHTSVVQSAPVPARLPCSKPCLQERDELPPRVAVRG